MPLLTGTTLTLESIEMFRNSLSVKGHSENTLKAYATDLRVLLLEIDQTEITPDELEMTAANWLTANRKIVSPKTTGRRLTSVRTFARWAGLGEILTDYRTPTPAKAIPHPLPEGIDGVRKLISVAKNENQKALVALMGLCGCRVAEALKTRPSHFNLQDMLLTIYGKGDKERIVPISVEAWEILAVPVTRAFVEGDREIVGLKDRGARKVITSLGTKAGLARSIASHDLRATFATAVYDRTKDLRLVQELLGHANSTTSEIYTLVSVNAMKAAVEL